MSKISLLGFTQHTVVIQTAAGEQKIPLAPGQAVACFLVDGHTEDEAHEKLRRMESVANITPEQIRQLEDYSAPLRGELNETDAQPLPAPDTEAPDHAAQPETVATENDANEYGRVWGSH